MSKQLLQEMSEGIRQRNVPELTQRIISKWEKTGLLEGLEDSARHPAKSNMAWLLENQAGQLLTEASTTADITGFQNVAFPIVRRVFAGLIANELVSVQPMSLPSGLLFYLDYRWDKPQKAGNMAQDFSTGGSLFGDRNSLADAKGSGGYYNLGGTAFSMRERVTTGTFAFALAAATPVDVGYDPDLVPAGTNATATLSNLFVATVTSGYAGIGDALALKGKNEVKQYVPVATGSTSYGTGTDGVPVQESDWVVYRRHTVISGNDLKFVVGSTAMSATQSGTVKLSYIIGSQLNQVKDANDNTNPAGTLTLDSYESDLGWPTSMPVIPELDFTIASVAVTANGRKLRAKWTPELAQDLAAYQNMDAEVELTQILSEAIALEIDREILGDLLANATGASFYWSRQPGKFLDKTTGNTAGGSFTGTVREWYETLIETIIDVANNIHRKTLRGAANFLVTSPDVATILEASVLYKPVLSMDPKETMFTVGTEKVGSLNNRFTVYKDPYFPRNKILVGFKGGSFLETGYVYAPYVPLIVTPTIYAPEDFTPRKGVMTRYAKKLVRSDFYGTVTVLDMNII